MEIVVGLYKNFATARMVIQELLDYGIERENIKVTKEQGTNGNQPGSTEEPISTAETSGHMSLDTLSALTVAGMRPLLGVAPVATPVAGIGNITADSVDDNIAEDEIDLYNINTLTPSTLITVKAPDEMVSHVADMMGRYRDLELEHDNQVPDEAALSRESNKLTENDSEMRLPVIEEQLQVSKRAVEQDSVRVHSRVIEEPVQKEVTVQEEKLHVERHAVNRPLVAQELDLFSEGTIEMTAMAEELVISKEARVVEEVIIQKNVTEHIETIEDTLRRRDVEVEAFNSQPQAEQFANHNQEFQAHYEQAYAQSSYTYPQILPAYRYGYTLANSAAYQNAHWNEIEAEIEQAWKKKNPNTWETFKDAIQYGWSRVRA